MKKNVMLFGCLHELYAACLYYETYGEPHNPSLHLLGLAWQWSSKWMTSGRSNWAYNARADASSYSGTIHPNTLLPKFIHIHLRRLAACSHPNTAPTCAFRSWSRSSSGRASFRDSTCVHKNGSGSKFYRPEAFLHARAFGAARPAPHTEPVEKPMWEPHKMSLNLFLSLFVYMFVLLLRNNLIA